MKGRKDGREDGWIYGGPSKCVRHHHCNFLVVSLICDGFVVVMVSGTLWRSYRLGLCNTAFTADSDTIVASQDKTGILNTPTARTAAHLLIKQLMVLILCDNCVPLIVSVQIEWFLPVVTCSRLPADDAAYLSTFISIKSAHLSGNYLQPIKVQV